jgi:S1-C subfamily serine protease
VRTGDIVVGVAGKEIRSLATFFRQVWALGDAGVDVPLNIMRGGRTIEVQVESADRRGFLKGPVLH